MEKLNQFIALAALRKSIYTRRDAGAIKLAARMSSRD